ncbi:MAG: Cell division ATP-binding protein FtsE [Parcubacteria group bacterium GW2011_GWA2_47_26]|nr:MAG: Cell division ATP-binding protein FtsE [Parcubacteria group bacterium GW2011_GWA2_47_26]
MITLHNVSKVYYPKVVALKDVSFTIKPGEFVSVVGQSGTGKTTVVKLLIAEERASAGRIEIGGWDITRIRHGEVPILRRQIGVVFQDLKLLPTMTAQENIAFALQVVGAPPQRIREVVPQVLKIVGLEDKADRYPIQLSGGEAQRVVIARALVHRPKIFIADEPTGNLDALNTREIMDILTKINSFGTTVVLVTHNRDVVNQLRRRVITLDHGEVISDQENGKYLL